MSWSRSVPPWTCATNFLYRAHGATTIERQSCNDPAGRLRVPWPRPSDHKEFQASIHVCPEWLLCVWTQYIQAVLSKKPWESWKVNSRGRDANPLVTGDWPTKRPVTRAENVPADSSWVLPCAAGMSNKLMNRIRINQQEWRETFEVNCLRWNWPILGEIDQS